MIFDNSLTFVREGTLKANLADNSFIGRLVDFGKYRDGDFQTRLGDGTPMYLISSINQLGSAVTGDITYSIQTFADAPDFAVANGDANGTATDDNDFGGIFGVATGGNEIGSHILKNSLIATGTQFSIQLPAGVDYQRYLGLVCTSANITKDTIISAWLSPERADDWYPTPKGVDYSDDGNKQG